MLARRPTLTQFECYQQQLKGLVHVGFPEHYQEDERDWRAKGDGGIGGEHCQSHQQGVCYYFINSLSAGRTAWLVDVSSIDG